MYESGGCLGHCGSPDIEWGWKKVAMAKEDGQVCISPGDSVITANRQKYTVDNNNQNVE